MAERIVRRKECDTGGCRKSKGVAKYTYIVRDANGQPVLDAKGEVIEDVTAENCPYHLDLNVRRLRQSAENTKVYPDLIEPSE